MNEPRLSGNGVSAFERAGREELVLSQGDIIRVPGLQSRNAVSNIQIGVEGFQRGAPTHGRTSRAATRRLLPVCDCRGRIGASAKRTRLGLMTSTELARHLSDAALAYRAARDDRTLEHLELLARDAAAHVRRVGEGTVDHIVLSSVLKLIAADVPSVERALQQVGWHWLP